MSEKLGNLRVIPVKLPLLMAIYEYIFVLPPGPHPSPPILSSPTSIIHPSINQYNFNDHLEAWYPDDHRREELNGLWSLYYQGRIWKERD